eukprot:CAMPEP_0174249726 /NCGR_PEP_ID=MMETSP0439-20130205/67_1 /TAXON_ID=0 /ORGANISM="Stereomyxa ramosa, Strain Chinc5" /LENGTH=224 /DNA_ID=CAMNT_0015329619 /DNA_START=90 /DNA_END=764 /DNA_ORIENTATION=+
MLFYRASSSTNGGLINQLKENNIVNNPAVEKVMRTIDRGHFSASSDDAYQDHPHSIGYGATISAPHMHAYCLEILAENCGKGARVLDVGSGSGYLSACFAEMVGETGHVLGIEIIPELVEWSISNIKKQNPEYLSKGTLRIKQGDGWKALEGEGLFDAIHVGAAAATVPSALIDHMAPGGKMVIPVGTYDQKLQLVEKMDDGTLVKRDLMGVRYVPLVNKDGRD